MAPLVKWLSLTHVNLTLDSQYSHKYPPMAQQTSNPVIGEAEIGRSPRAWSPTSLAELVCWKAPNIYFWPIQRKKDWGRGGVTERDRESFLLLLVPGSWYLSVIIIIIIIIYGVYVCMVDILCVDTHATVCMWQWEDNFVESVVPSPLVCSGLREAPYTMSQPVLPRAF